MKLRITVMAFALSIAFAASGESRGFRQGGGHRPGQGPGPGFQQLSADQQAAFQQCLIEKGVTPPAKPQRPELTEEQKAVFEGCRQQGGDRESFKACIEASGIALPARPEHPRPNEDQMQVIHACRQQVVGQ